MNRPWLDHYPPYLVREIDPDQYASLVELFEEAFGKFKDRTAYIGMDVRMSFAELDRLSTQFAAYLQSRGLTPGARVAVMMPNCLAYPVSLAAILRAGYVVVNVNPLYTPRELKHQLSDSGAEAIVILENMAATLQPILKETALKMVAVATLGDFLGGLKGTLVRFVVRRVKKMVPPYSLPGSVKFESAVKAGAALRFARPALSSSDPAFLQYTGGTTGVSKGAVLTHRNMVANLLQTEALTEPALRKLPNEQVHIVCALPLYHVYALTCCALMGMRIGAANILIPNPRDIPAFIATLKKYPFNVLPAVNTLYNALLNHPDFKTLDFSPLKIANGGGMAIQRPVAERWMAATGTPIIEGYGLSETSPVATSNPVLSAEFTGTIGQPVPSTDVAIRDDDGNDLPIGEAGEICIRGPQVMAGYWQRPEETARVMMADGFFRTGDIGIMDERGFTKIVDRKKDMILVSGFNVYPNEIEEVVAGHPGVLECAVVGVPDAHSGEAVKLFVVAKDPDLTEEALRDYCKTELTAYKRPRHIEFREELPKTPVGKVLRRELRDE